MKKNKDFTYYGKKRLRVQRIKKVLKEDKTHYDLWVFIPLALLGLIYDIKTNFSFDFSTTGGILSTILFVYLSWLIASVILLVILEFLDKYYFKKRQELLEEYIKEKGNKRIVIGGDNE